MAFGLIILAIGAIALMVKLDIIQGSIWGFIWPVALIIIGLSFVMGRFWKRSFWVSRFGGHCCGHHDGEPGMEHGKEHGC